MAMFLLIECLDKEVKSDTFFLSKEIATNCGSDIFLPSLFLNAFLYHVINKSTVLCLFFAGCRGGGKSKRAGRAEKNPETLQGEKMKCDSSFAAGLS